jgi:hypothetical protein
MRLLPRQIEHVVYCIENQLDGKTYVGRTKGTLNTRWQSHRHAKSTLGRAIRSNGLSAFTVRVLATCHWNEATALERLFTHLLESNVPQFGYNSPNTYRWPE